MANNFTFDDLLLEILGAANSPLDRRGPQFGIAPGTGPVKLAGARPGAVPAQIPAGGFGVKPKQAPIPGYEREFRVINQQTGGIVPHQGLKERP